MEQRCGVVIWGCGKLGEALAFRLLEKGIVAAENVLMIRRSKRALSDLQRDYKTFVATPDNLDLQVQFAATLETLYLFYFVPSSRGISRETADFLTAISPKHAQLVIGCAGIDLATFDCYPETHPTYALFNMGISSVASAVCIVPSADYTNSVPTLLEAIAVVVPITAQQHEAATVLSSSAPALIVRLLQAMSLAGVKMGMHQRDALRLLSLAAISAGDLLQYQSADHIIDQIATPGGCTVEGLLELDHRNVAAGVQESLLAVAERLYKTRLNNAHTS